MLEVSRRELKYITLAEESLLLERRIAKVLDADPHNSDEGYLVRSVYFDSVSDTDYHEKVDGLDHRKKIRLRIYNGDTGLIKLELKRKDGDFQRKSSLSLSREEAERMLEVDYGFLMERPEGIAHGLYTLMVTRFYRPKIVIEYRRKAYTADTNDIRVTFDRGMRAWADPTSFLEPLTDSSPVTDISESTLEVKYNGFLYLYIKEALMAANRTRTSNSKYVRARNRLMI